MSGSTSVPFPTFGPNGFVAPDRLDILAGVQDDTTAAFGGQLSLDLRTSQGQLMTSWTEIIATQNDQFVALANNVDPAYASGRYQDAIARIYFLEREPPVPTTLVVNCTGLLNVLIPKGTLIVDSANLFYAAQSATLIPKSGSVQITFTCLSTGPVPIPSSVRIYQSIFGWNTASLVSGTVGRDVESRADFEVRRQNTVAANAAGFLSAIRGAVLKVPGVTDAYVTENPTGAPVTTGGQTIAANSIFVCVAGGNSQQAIAQAIFTKKNPGCGMTGNISVTVQDTNSGYSFPYPSYTIKYQTPTNPRLSMDVTLASNSDIPDDALQQIQDAAYAAFTGADGGTRAQIGSTIFASRFYAGISALGPWVEIIEIQIQTSANPDAIGTITIAGSVMTVAALGSGAFAVGEHIQGGAVAPGTVITSLGTGTGGTGTYNLNISQTVSSTVVSGMKADQNSVPVNINAAPIFDQLDLNVILI